jgi:hypothetical protein
MRHVAHVLQVDIPLRRPFLPPSLPPSLLLFFQAGGREGRSEKGEGGEGSSEDGITQTLAGSVDGVWA